MADGATLKLKDDPAGPGRDSGRVVAAGKPARRCSTPPTPFPETLMPVIHSPVTHSPATQATRPARLQRLFALVPVALALAACGGGSDDTVATDPPVTPTALVLTGTAATGAAISGQVVSARCSGATTEFKSAATGADGNFSITASGARLPCVLQVTAADGTVLHSLATGSGSTAQANITPVSELVVANLSADNPATYYGGFSTAAAAGLTPAKADEAVSSVVATLNDAGLALPADTHVLTGTLRAANGSTEGNPLDKALDRLKSRLASLNPSSDFKTSLLTLGQAIARASRAATTTTLNSTASLPPELLLQPAAPNCSALRSGKYRVVVNREHPASEGHDTEVVTVDAPALRITNANGSVHTLVDIGNCRYRRPANGSTPDNGELVVSQAGVVVFQAADDAGVFHLGVAFPVQTHPVSALAGEWNSLQLDRTEDAGPIVLTNGTWTFDASGKLTAATFCEPGADCASGTLAATADFPVVTHTINADGGFNAGNAGATAVYSDRVFLYRTGGGELLRISLTDAGGHLSLWTRKAAGTLPAVDRVSESWNITQNNNYTAGAFSESKNTIRSVDATANSFLRDAVTNLTTSATRPETFRINNPRDGFSLRVAANGVAASDGSISNVSEFVALGLRGTGISAVGFPANNTLILSVGK